MLAVVLALGAAASYGVSDFFGGLAARKWRVFPVTLISFGAAGTVLAILLPFTGGAWSTGALWSGWLAALTAVVGFLTFYAALAAGPISIVTPLIALLNSLVPLGWSLLFGVPLGPVTWIAIGLAVVGSVLIGVERNADMHSLRPRTLVLTLISGLSFGFGALALGSAPVDSGLIVVFIDSAGGTLMLVVVGLIALGVPAVRRALAVLDAHGHAELPDATGERIPEPALAGAGPRPDPDPHPAPVDDAPVDDAPDRPSVRGGIRLGILSGVVTGLANAMLINAFHRGDLAVVAVLNNLYPLTTMLLAWFVLRERISLMQTLGAVLAVTASVMLGVS